jgi:hypothetical protein
LFTHLESADAVGARDFTVTVSPVAPSTKTPTLTVTFADNGATLGTMALSTQSQATFTTATLSPGSHKISADYGGDSAFSGSSNSIAQSFRIWV